ncbi:hypothetical protein AL473_09675 [Klebsiella quasipneumoniae]|nr:hypothetical protein AL473_09675 [Klebsiella quasipneumoniae]AWO60500.1 hypothetical protein DLJ73_05305 [Klebsiella quasipneumoniae subsp. similipneumoniae]
MALVTDTVHGFATTLPFTVIVTSAACNPVETISNSAAKRLPDFVQFTSTSGYWNSRINVASALT